MNPPPTPALDLVVEALNDYARSGRYAPGQTETAARALLQKLDALSGNNDREVCHQEEQKKLSPPDAIRAAEPVRVDDVEVTLLLERLARVPGRLCRDAAAMIERLHTTPPSGAALRDASPAQGWWIRGEDVLKAFGVDTVEELDGITRGLLTPPPAGESNNG